MIVPEPCGYAVLLLIANIQKTVPCGRIENYIPVGVPSNGLLTSLRLLVRCLPPATTRGTGGGKKGKEGRRKREGEGRGEERRKEVGYTGSTQPSRLSSS